eukprot:gb/GEZJ01006891.1/.p2 GENE.gb/GEZJ01006891.1/~~gb/GEZJ01006891.1/.p2  ORF type:complete len:102 (+),score=8.38 gb/GEZJ01006891.1/:139-444(+)
MLARMYQKIVTRSDLDAGRHDLFACQFLQLFNDETFEPEIADAVCRATEDVPLVFNPNESSHVRIGTTLKKTLGKIAISVHSCVREVQTIRANRSGYFSKL